MCIWLIYAQNRFRWIESVQHDGKIEVLLIIRITCFAVGLLVFCVELLAFILERLTPNIVYRVRTNRPLVALSFDDGPHPIFTPQVLALLESHDAKATFFLIADRVLRHPNLVAHIKAAGHEVANHYFKNGSSLGHSDTEFLQHLVRFEHVASGWGTEVLAIRAITQVERRGVGVCNRLTVTAKLHRNEAVALCGIESLIQADCRRHGACLHHE